ncbi:hypothetical protein GGI35DRAFT_490871 [Trichoderma velutinum]
MEKKKKEKEKKKEEEKEKLREEDFQLYWSIRLEDKKGKSFGDAAYKSKKDSFSSQHVSDCIRALLNHKILKEAFDPLLEVPGLRKGMQFTTLNKLCCAKSDEEAAAYLRHTFNLWQDITLGNPKDMGKIDSRDVKALELRCPKLCSRDATDIDRMFAYETIFTAFSQEERKVMKEKILSIDYVIPSLYTFFKDMLLLEHCAASMRHIVTPSYQTTIRATLRRNYKLEKLEQTTKETNSSPTEASPTASFNVAMELLWIFVLGEFQRMLPPNRGTGSRFLAGYLEEKPNMGVLVRFAKLARNLGFETPEIIQLSQLTMVGDSEHSTEDSQLQSMNPNFAAFLFPGNTKRPSYKSVASYARALRQRCGRPKHEVYQRDRHFLTKDLIHFNYGSLGVQSGDLTSLLVLRSQCLLFFSYPKEELAQVVVSETSVADTNGTLEQSHPSDLTGLEDIRDGVSEIPSPWQVETSESIFSHNNREEKVPLGDRQVSLSKPISSHQPARKFPFAKVQFITYEDGQFKNYAQFNVNDIAGIVEIAEGLLNQMVLYDHTIKQITPEDLSDPKQDIDTIIVLPRENLKVDDELRDAAKAYTVQGGIAVRSILRRYGP